MLVRHTIQRLHQGLHDAKPIQFLPAHGRSCPSTSPKLSALSQEGIQLSALSQEGIQHAVPMFLPARRGKIQYCTPSSKSGAMTGSTGTVLYAGHLLLSYGTPHRCIAVPVLQRAKLVPRQALSRALITADNA